MEAIRVEQVSKRFGGLYAVKDVSFSLPAGERLGLIGPNGAGKTTLFNILNGQHQATTGRTYFFGRDITRLPTFRRLRLGISRSFQITSLFSDLTVLQNAILALQATRPCRNNFFSPVSSHIQLRDDVRQLLQSVDMWDQKDQLINSLSYGEQRKLDIVMAMASNPRLLLLDEPSCGLTSDESDEIAQRIRDLGRETTVILVAHDMDLLFGVVDRILVLNNGTIVEEGTCDHIRCSSIVREIYLGSEDTDYA